MEDLTRLLADATISLKNYIQQYGVLITSCIVTFIMAMARTRKQNGKADILESLMCSIFTMGAWSILIYLNVPEIVAVGIGAYIGHAGSLRIRNRIEGFLKDAK